MQQLIMRLMLRSAEASAAVVLHAAVLAADAATPPGSFVDGTAKVRFVATGRCCVQVAQTMPRGIWPAGDPRGPREGRLVFDCLLVCLFVGLFVCTNFNIGHNFCNIEDSNLIFGMHVYLMKLHILSGERSRSSFKVKKIVHVHLMELHILSGERSRSSFKVKGHFFFKAAQ